MIWLSKTKIFGNVLKINRFTSVPAVNNLRTDILARRYETQTKVAKDVILYKYDNTKFYKYLNVFAIVQFVFWSLMGKFSVDSMRDVPVVVSVDEDLPWWRKVNLGEGKYKKTLATTCYVFAFTILSCTWMFTLRSVRFLILNKGGDKISFVTYTPLGKNRILTVPLNKVSSVSSRIGSKTSLPIKIYGHSFYYLLDMRGEFKNAQLFDYTAGLQRKFTKK